MDIWARGYKFKMQHYDKTVCPNHVHTVTVCSLWGQVQYVVILNIKSMQFGTQSKCKEGYSSIAVFSSTFDLFLSFVTWLLTFIVVVLHCDDASSGGPAIVDDGLGVQGFEGERVDHADVNSFWGTEEGGGCTSVQLMVHTRTEYCHADIGWFLLFRLSSYLSSAGQQQPEPRGGSLLLQSQSRDRHWFYTPPEWDRRRCLYVNCAQSSIWDNVNKG